MFKPYPRKQEEFQILGCQDFLEHGSELIRFLILKNANEF